MTDARPVPVTIVTTVYQGHDHWPGYLANIAKIIGPDDLVVIVDDGSKPSLSLPDDLNHDNRLRLISPGRVGRGAALNIAIKAAPNGIICIQDVDDQSQPGRLDYVRAYLADIPSQLLLTAAQSSTPSSKVANSARLPRTIPPARLYRGNPFHHSSLAFHKGLWHCVGGYDADLPCCIDLDFYLRCISRAQAVLKYSPIPLITRHRGLNRHYRGISPALYHRTALNIRRTYRSLIKPPLWTLLYDLRHRLALWKARPQIPHILAMVQLPPPVHGAAVMNHHAIEALRDAPVDLDILPMRFADKVSSVGHAGWRKIVTAGLLWGRLFGRCLLGRPDILYICFAPSGAAFWRDSLYVLTARLFRAHAILHLHGRGLARQRQESKLAAIVQERVLSGQTIILLGESLRPEVKGLKCQTRILPNCVPDAAFASHAPIFADPDKPVRLLFLANLFRTKGIDTVIAACARLADRGIAFTLDVAGAEGDVSVAHLQTTINAAGIGHLCRYHGVADPQLKADLLAKADLLLFPTRYVNEAQPLVVLEAMAAGVGIITTDIGTLGQIIRMGETGWICNPDAPDELAALICEAISTPVKTRKMAATARQECRLRFSQARFSQNLQDLITGTVSQRRERP